MRQLRSKEAAAAAAAARWGVHSQRLIIKDSILSSSIIPVVLNPCDFYICGRQKNCLSEFPAYFFIQLQSIVTMANPDSFSLYSQNAIPKFFLNIIKNNVNKYK